LPLEGCFPERREELVALLTEAFGLSKTAPFLEPGLMRWKYDDPRPDWAQPRSYAWTQNGRIMAHGAICPVVYRAASRQVPAAHVIDWAAYRGKGAGTLLMKNLNTHVPVLLVVGGSPATRRILPKIGYRTAGQVSFFARVARPWRQFRTDPLSRGWKGPLKLARNVLLNRSGAAPSAANWACSSVSFTGAGRESLPDAETSWFSTFRSAELMNYFTRCPAAAWSTFLLRNNGIARGWFVLARIGSIVRIVDLRLHRPSQDDLNAAYFLAGEAALTEPDVCQIVATACTPPAVTALGANGFRFHHADPIFVLDPQQLLIGAPFEVALIESDAAYHYDPNNPYLS
jgi:hypothetical protein